MPGASYRFGAYAADRTAYRVTEGSTPLDLTPKLLDLLFYLLDHAGDLVTKEELLDALWPDANVTENALAQAVSELRQALDDDPGAPQFIKTVARRGYRFVGVVTPLTRTPPPPAGVPPASADPDERRRTIAVLDFTNVSGDADAAWLSAGIAETVTNDLGGLGAFKVVDRWRVMEASRRTDGSIDRMAAELGAGLVVIGGYQRHGDHIRITARVVDVVSGEAIGDAKADGPLDRIFELQDQVVAQFASELGLSLAQASGRGARETPNLEAYRAFTEGWLRLETLDVREMPRAIADFQRAIAIDGRYALAHTGLASAEYALYETTRSDNAPAQDLLTRSIDHARHAIDLDGTLADAHATLALLLVSAWKTTEAVAAARRAIALEPANWRHLFRLSHASWGEQRLRAAASTLALYPDFAFAHFHIAMVHVARGHLAEAETVLRQGAAVQDRQIARGERYPALGLHWLLGLVRLAQDDAVEALVEFDREETRAEPHRLYGREFAMHARLGRAAAHLRGGRFDEAIESFRGALELYPDHAQSHLGLSLALRGSGSDARAKESLAKAERALATLTEKRPVEAAIVRVQLLTSHGRPADAATVCNRMLDDAPPGFAGWTLPVEPFLAGSPRDALAAALARLAERAS